jgi:hypothetical protein
MYPVRSYRGHVPLIGLHGAERLTLAWVGILGQGGMAQGEDSLASFFFHICFVYPATSWILKPGRFSRGNGILMAIGFLTLLAAAKTVSPEPETWVVI